MEKPHCGVTLTEEQTGWSVVHFPFSEEISLVPNNWLKKENNIILCSWPTGDTDISKKIKKCVAVNKEWPHYTVEILGQSTSYKEGKETEKALLNRSMEKVLGRGHRTVKKKYDQNFISVMSISPPPDLNDCPGLDNEQVLNDTAGSHEINGEYVVDSDGKLSKMKNVISESEENDTSNDVTTSNAITHEGTDELSLATTVTLVSEPSTSKNEGSQSMEIKTYGLLIEVREIVKDIRTFLQQNMQGCSVTRKPNLDTRILQEPFKKFKHLREFDGELSTDEARQDQLVTLFSLFGGASSKEAIIRGLKRLFSNKLAKKCSWTGRLKNFPIKDLCVINILKTAIRKRFADLTDHYFEFIVKQWFKQANLRYSRENEKQSEH